MFFERLMNQTNSPLLERVLQFTEARGRLLTENIANASTPGYAQKDLSVEKFQLMLQNRVAERDGSPRGTTDFSDVQAAVEHPTRGILFHDGNNRSMEELQTDFAKNAMLHNLVIEMLRKQYAEMDMALKERVG